MCDGIVDLDTVSPAGVPNIRQALIDRYGGRERAIDAKYLPGPLHAIVRDVWTMRLAEPPEPSDWFQSA